MFNMSPLNPTHFIFALIKFLKNKRPQFLFLFLSLILGSTAFSQNISYNYKTYDVEEGLPSSEVYCLIKDAQGYLWFGTDAGVSRFNGYEFTNYSIVDGLSDNTIFTIYEDYRGRIWFLGFTGGISYYENGLIHSYRHNDKLLEALEDKGHISKLIVGHDETIRFCLYPWGSGKIEPEGEITIHSTREDVEISHPFLRAIAEENDQILIARKLGEKKLSLYLKRNGQEEFITEHGSATYYSYSYLLDSNSSFFIVGDILGYVNPDTILTKKFGGGFCTVNMNAEGQVWLTEKNKGIKIYKNTQDLFGGKDPIMTLFNGLTISQILFEQHGAVWLSIEDRGVCYIYNYHIDNYLSNVGNRTEISAMCKNEFDELFYVGETGEVYKVDTLGVHSFLFDIEMEVNSIYFAAPNKLFVTNFQNISHKTWQENGYEIHSLNGRNLAIIDDTELWRITSAGINKEISGEIVFKSNGVNFFKTVCQDSSGIVWIGGNKGLYKYENKEITSANHLLGENREKTKVNRIRVLNSKTILIATKSSGLHILTRKNGEYLDQIIPLDSETLNDVYFDDEQGFWIASNKGILNAKIDSTGHFSLRKINHLNGLPSSQVNHITGINNIIYAGTNNGLVKFDKKFISPNNNPPKLLMNPILVNGKPQDSLKTPFQFSHNQNHIEFSFIGLSGYNPGSINYRYRLNGIEQNWKYTKSRSISYPSLPPNDYLFIVEASNEDGFWSEAQQIPFSITSPFWKRGVFIAIAGFLLFILISAYYNYKEKRKLEKYEKSRQFEEQKRKVIEAKLIALRSQMNPHFTFNSLAAIQNVMINFSVKEAVDYMGKFSSLVRKILENSENLYIYLDEELEMLQLYLMLENIRFNNEIDYSFKVAPSIEQDFVEIPSMIIQPFIENAIIHGLAPKNEGIKRIEVEFHEDFESIYCSITDTGVGRKKAREIAKKSGIKHQSLGIKITEERLKLFGAGENDEFAFEIKDLYDDEGTATGTQVQIKLKKKDDDQRS